MKIVVIKLNLKKSCIFNGVYSQADRCFQKELFLMVSINCLLISVYNIKSILINKLIIQVL